jgi:hypothetical protein
MTWYVNTPLPFSMYSLIRDIAQAEAPSISVASELRVGNHVMHEVAQQYKSFYIWASSTEYFQEGNIRLNNIVDTDAADLGSVPMFVGIYEAMLSQKRDISDKVR